MANKKFSEFTSQTDSANVQFVVGYNGSDNVRISPSNLLGAYLPLVGGTMTGNIIFNDNVSALFGTSSDMTIKHDGSHSKIENNTGHLYITNESDDKDIIFTTDDGSGGTIEYLRVDGGAENINISKDTVRGDNVKASWGDANDFQIYHDGSNSYIKDTGTGNLFIQAAVNVQIESSTSGENMAVFNENGAVDLYYDNSKKFETTSSGIDITGTTDTDNLTIAGAQGSDGQVLTSTGSGVAWEDASGGATSLNGLTDVLIDGTSSYLVNIPASLSGNPADNTVFGNGAGNALTSGSSNTFIGHDAGAGVSGDEDNVAIGEGAFSASNVFKAVAVGYHAGKNNNGNYNVFIGENAGYNTSSSNNTSVGNNAGRSVTANDHTSIGYQAGYSNTSGSENTNVGHASGYSNTTSSHRTSIGYYANQYITGNQNTAVGSYALRGVSGSSTGQYNTAVGYTAGEDMTTGTTNTLVGWGAGKDITTGSNNSCIGNGSAPSANDATNEITLGNSSITAIRCQVQTISALSDERDKTNIEDSAYGLDLINSLKPVTFDWNMRDGAKVGEKDLGFIAQDLQEVDDENLQLVYSNNPEKLEASYGRLIPVLVKAIQDLSAKVTELENA